MCILLVEDEWMIREVVAEELAESGFEVREAENGDRASALIAEASVPFSLLVTDVHMPGRLDGIEVARLMRARWPDVPVIYATGRPDALNGIGPLGTRDVLLRKPFAPSELLAAARRLLDAGHQALKLRGGGIKKSRATCRRSIRAKLSGFVRPGAELD